MFFRHLAGAFAALAAAGAIVATRFAVDEIDATYLAFGRYLLAAICLAPFSIIILRSEPLGRRDFWNVILIGLALFGLAPWLFNQALTLTTASRGAIAFGAAPLFGAMAWLLFQRIRPGTVQIAALMVCAIGLFIALAGGTEAETATKGRHGVGDLMMLGAALVTGAAVAAAKPILDRTPVLLVVGVALAAGVAGLAVPMGLQAAEMGLPRPTNTGLLILLFLGVPAGCLVIALALWTADGMKPATLAWYFVVSTLAGLSGAIVLLGEPIAASLLIGVILVAVAVLAVFWRPKPQRQERRGYR